ncbi:MAG: hypothetical protein HY554_09225, partial [Elusimicrobia bacterium]|nr:hypothetical protein [Elusimicrobiota bacterium]
MEHAPKVYKKHQSFVALKTHHALPDALARVRKLLDGLPPEGKAGARGEVVRRACEELLDLKDGGGFEKFSLHWNTAEEISRLADAELPRYLHYRFRYEAWPERKILDRFPPCVQLEPTSACNFRCVFCYQTD